MSTANVERFPLPESQVPCTSCGSTEQWADLIRRPSHALMTDHERLTRKAINEDGTPNAAVEKALLHLFVTEWHILDFDGAEIPHKIASYGTAPQDTVSVLVEEVQAITAATRPNDAIGNTVAVMRALKARVGTDEATKIDQAIAMFREALGVPVPNAGDQTES